MAANNPNSKLVLLLLLLVFLLFLWLTLTNVHSVLPSFSSLRGEVCWAKTGVKTFLVINPFKELIVNSSHKFVYFSGFHINNWEPIYAVAGLLNKLIF